MLVGAIGSAADVHALTTDALLASGAGTAARAGAAAAAAFHPRAVGNAEPNRRRRRRRQRRNIVALVGDADLPWRAAPTVPTKQPSAALTLMAVHRCRTALGLIHAIINGRRPAATWPIGQAAASEEASEQGTRRPWCLRSSASLRRRPLGLYASCSRVRQLHLTGQRSALLQPRRRHRGRLWLGERGGSRCHTANLGRMAVQRAPGHRRPGHRGTGRHGAASGRHWTSSGHWPSSRH